MDGGARTLDSDSVASWCVVMAKPMSEELAEKSIRSAGFRVYLPRSSKVIRGTRIDERGNRARPRGEVVMRPAFRGYLFFELWPDQQWRRLLDSRVTRGVAGIIVRGDRPVKLPNAVIVAIREQEAAGDLDEPRGLRCRATQEGSKRRDDLTPGDIVRLTEGPFATFLAELSEQDDQGRADVLVRMMGRDVPVRTEARTLEHVNA